MRLPTFRYQGLAFRAHNPRWAYAPTSGEGAARHGGRFNPRGMPALYLSEHLETAWLEAQQGFAFKAQPMTMCAYRVDSEDALDLTDPTTLAALGLPPPDLACPWERLDAERVTPPSWTLATRLASEGAALVRVPSFAPGAGPADNNLVVWRWSDTLPHQVTVIDDHARLPRDARSWG